MVTAFSVEGRPKRIELAGDGFEGNDVLVNELSGERIFFVVEAFCERHKSLTEFFGEVTDMLFEDLWRGCSRACKDVCDDAVALPKGP